MRSAFQEAFYVVGREIAVHSHAFQPAVIESNIDQEPVSPFADLLDSGDGRVMPSEPIDIERSKPVIGIPAGEAKMHAEHVWLREIGDLPSLCLFVRRDLASLAQGFEGFVYFFVWIVGIVHRVSPFNEGLCLDVCRFSDAGGASH